MKIIITRNDKGGVGKTNIAISISTALNLSGIKTALIDTEESGTANYLMNSVNRENYLKAVKKELQEKIANSASTFKHYNGYVEKLAAVENALNFKTIYSSIENEEDKENQKVIKTLISLRDAGYEYVVIDTPGKNLDSVKMLANLADLVLMPQRDTVLDFNGVVKSLDGIEDLSKCKRVIWDDRSACFEDDNLIEENKIIESEVSALNSKISNSKGFNRSLSKGLGVCEMNMFSSGKEKSSTNKASLMIADIIKEIKQLGV